MSTGKHQVTDIIMVNVTHEFFIAIVTDNRKQLEETKGEFFQRFPQKKNISRKCV